MSVVFLNGSFFQMGMLMTLTFLFLYETEELVLVRFNDQVPSECSDSVAETEWHKKVLQSSKNMSSISALCYALLNECLKSIDA